MWVSSVHWHVRIACWAVSYAVAAVAAALAVMQATGHVAYAVLASALVLALMLLHITRLNARLQSLYRALAGSVVSYRDGDFSFGLRWPHEDEISELVTAHNALGHALREQRQALVQRELLLDTVVQHTPVALTLIDAAGRVVLGNLAARRLLGEGRTLEGRKFSGIVDAAHPALRNALDQGGDALFAVGQADNDDEDGETILHLSRRHFRLNGRAHELVLLRELTAELRRQEVQTWKKVIRVISHELNNSLAPIASLAHSARRLLERGDTARLAQALDVIEERTRHLEGFIRGYARFARLPAPNRQPQTWAALLDGLRTQFAFAWDRRHAQDTVRIDGAQMQQALLNLVKNAIESGGAPDAVRLELRRLPSAWRIEVMDRGPGMNDAVLAQALLPFYSTRRGGTGLGLALAREIIEAHGGHIALANRKGGGLAVSLTLPD